jgi:hypothetical protein
MEEIEFPEREIEQETDRGLNNNEPIIIMQNNVKYNLNIESQNNKITFSIYNNEQFPNFYYTKKISLKELKDSIKGNDEFMDKNFDIYNCFKKLSNDNKLNIKKDKNIILLIISSVDLNGHEVSGVIQLSPRKNDINMTINDIYIELKYLKEKIKDIDSLKNENKILKGKIEAQDKEIKYLKNKINNISNKSVIIKEDESEMITSEIEKKTNKKIKEIKKLYQATIDGGNSEIFHKKCDNIANTLILIKSEGKRRFGGFASECTKSDRNSIIDKNCFLFSLDKKKIYPPKDNNYYKPSCYEYEGPSFIYKGIYCISIGFKSAITNKTLRTNESGHKDVFENDPNALSEDGNFKGIYAEEYEVFQILF